MHETHGESPKHYTKRKKPKVEDHMIWCLEDSRKSKAVEWQSRLVIAWVWRQWNEIDCTWAKSTFWVMEMFNISIVVVIIH